MKELFTKTINGFEFSILKHNSLKHYYAKPLFATSAILFDNQSIDGLYQNLESWVRKVNETF